ncbi:MAG: Permease of the major facilitator superfamily [Myxococcales bacterium]|nr:Permease of the major facilitator superfamily [Myxococcales bacterium]
MIRHRTAIVALLTGLNFLNYLDRYIVAAVLPPLMLELGLSNFEGGLLATVFLLGYFATSPLFGKLGDRLSRKKLIAFGVLTWSAATIASGLSNSLWTLLAARAAVGIGEASYATLAPTIIDDVSPPDKKGKMMAIFFLAVPVGSALGFLLGGFIQARWGWRTAFFVGGGPGIVLSLLCLAIQEPVRTHLADAKAKITQTARTMFRVPLYRRAVLGYCAHTAAIGAFSFWAPTFISRHFLADLSDPTKPNAAAQALKNANFTFGLITVVAGAIGTVIGGIMADRALRGLPVIPEGASHDHVHNRMAANAQLKVCAIGVAIAFPLTAAAFLAPSAWLFFAFAGLAEVGLFLSTSPINLVLMRTVPAFMRASAMAVAIFSIHLLGDLWSPSVLGLSMDYLPISLAMMLLPFGFAVATAVWWPRKHEGEAGPAGNLPPARLHAD